MVARCTVARLMRELGLRGVVAGPAGEDDDCGGDTAVSRGPGQSGVPGHAPERVVARRPHLRGDVVGIRLRRVHPRRLRAAHRGLASVELAAHRLGARRARAGAVRALSRPSCPRSSPTPTESQATGPPEKSKSTTGTSSSWRCSRSCRGAKASAATAASPTACTRTPVYPSSAPHPRPGPDPLLRGTWDHKTHTLSLAPERKQWGITGTQRAISKLEDPSGPAGDRLHTTAMSHIGTEYETTESRTLRRGTHPRGCLATVRTTQPESDDQDSENRHTWEEDTKYLPPTAEVSDSSKR